MQKNFRLQSFSPDDVRFGMEVMKDGTEVVFSVPYDRDWHLYIDGERVETICRENYLLGGVMGIGNHDVHMRYIPIALYFGMILSLVSVTVVILLSIRSRTRA